jgi:hypothetical protein
MKHVLVMTFTILLATLGNLSSGHATPPYVPGVKAGDWWRYDARGCDRNACRPLTTNEHVTSIAITVTGVTSNNVTLSIITDQGDTKIALAGSLSGGGNLTGFTDTEFYPVQVLIGAGLGANDPISNAPYAPVITETATRSYAGYTRDINILNVTVHVRDKHYESRLIDYWDKTSGVLLWLHNYGHFKSIHWSVSLNLTNSNTGFFQGRPPLAELVAPDLPVILTIGTVSVLVALGVAHGRRKTEARRAPRHPERLISSPLLICGTGLPV